MNIEYPAPADSDHLADEHSHKPAPHGASSAWRTILEITQRFPSSWMLLGLFLLLVSCGSVALNICGVHIQANPPEAPMLCGCVSTLGISLILLSLYVVAHSCLPLGKTAAAMFAAFWALWVGSIFLKSWNSQSDRSHMEWGYVYSMGHFDITIPADSIQQFQGQSLMMIVRRRVDSIPFEDDSAVLFSELYPVCVHTGDVKGDVDVDRSLSGVKLGDIMDCEVVVVPNDFNRRDIHTINQVYAHGGRHFTKVWNIVRLDKDFEKALPKFTQEIGRDAALRLSKRLNALVQSDQSLTTVTQ